MFDCSFWQRWIDRSFTQRDDDDVDVLKLISFSFDSRHQNDIISHTFLSFFLILLFSFAFLQNTHKFLFPVFLILSLSLAKPNPTKPEKKLFIDVILYFVALFPLRLCFLLASQRADFIALTTDLYLVF